MGGLPNNKMEIKRPDENELKGLIPLYKKEFPVHNIFQKKTDEEIVTYLKEADETYEIYVGIENEKVVAGAVLIQTSSDVDKNHLVWKFRHFAAEEGAENKAKELLTHLESVIKEQSQTAKIELTLAEGEQKYIEISKSHGYVLEGTLANHYRFGENTYLYGKSIQ